MINYKMQLAGLLTAFRFSSLRTGDRRHWCGNPFLSRCTKALIQAIFEVERSEMLIPTTGLRAGLGMTREKNYLYLTNHKMQLIYTVAGPD